MKFIIILLLFYALVCSWSSKKNNRACDISLLDTLVSESTNAKLTCKNKQFYGIWHEQGDVCCNFVISGDSIISYPEWEPQDQKYAVIGDSFFIYYSYSEWIFRSSYRFLNQDTIMFLDYYGPRMWYREK